MNRYGASVMVSQPPGGKDSISFNWDDSKPNPPARQSNTSVNVSKPPGGQSSIDLSWNTDARQDDIAPPDTFRQLQPSYNNPPQYQQAHSCVSIVQPPGGRSTINLGWDADPEVKIKHKPSNQNLPPKPPIQSNMQYGNNNIINNSVSSNISNIPLSQPNKYPNISEMNPYDNEGQNYLNTFGNKLENSPNMVGINVPLEDHPETNTRIMPRDYSSDYYNNGSEDRNYYQPSTDYPSSYQNGNYNALSNAPNYLPDEPTGYPVPGSSYNNQHFPNDNDYPINNNNYNNDIYHDSHANQYNKPNYESFNVPSNNIQQNKPRPINNIVNYDASVHLAYNHNNNNRKIPRKSNEEIVNPYSDNTRAPINSYAKRDAYGCPYFTNPTSDNNYKSSVYGTKKLLQPPGGYNSWSLDTMSDDSVKKSPFQSAASNITNSRVINVKQPPGGHSSIQLS